MTSRYTIKLSNFEGLPQEARGAYGSEPFKQCRAINVGFELYIGIKSKLSISIIGFDLELGEFCHDFHSISIPINHSGTHFSLPAISTSLK